MLAEYGRKLVGSDPAAQPLALSVAMEKWLWPTFRDGICPACLVASRS
jgi:hypothetical protein